MGHSIGDAYIVMALAAVGIAFMYFRFRERQQRLDVIHKERLAAMEKGIPLPELAIDPPKRLPDPHAPLIHGIVWLAFGGGAMMALRLFPIDAAVLWPLPLPLALLGCGLILYYVIVSRQR